MQFRQFITAASLALFSMAASAAQIVIPAAGSSAGVGGSQWQSELTLHNTASHNVTVSVTYHQGAEVSAPVLIDVAARGTASIADIVNTRFARGGTGALVIDIADADAAKVAITSRTFNVSEAGEFGQDIPAVRTNEAATSGDTVVLSAPSSAVNTRFNFGVYAVDATTIQWELIRSTGTVAGTREVAYAAGSHLQYNAGIKALFGAEPSDNDTIHAKLASGRAILYGSAINNRTGDPSFVPGVRTREEIRINFTGIDLDENGTVDIGDADHDGVLDQTIEMATSLFPNYFRVVAIGENGEKVTYEIVFSSADAALLDSEGTVQLAPGGNLKGTKGELRLRASAGGSSAVLVIPISFK